MRIRKATGDDAATIARLNTIVQELHHHHLPGRFKEPDPGAFAPVVGEWLASGSRVVFVAEADDGEPVGYAMAVVHARPGNALTFGGTVVELDQLAVSPTSRRSGVGTSLVDHVVAYAHRVGADRVELSVHAFNEEAQAFFVGAGFRTSVIRMAMALGEPPPARASTLRRIERVVFFVDDVEAAVTWYQDVLDGTVDRTRLSMVVAGHVHIAFHRADAKTPAGVGGAVAYCGVDSFDTVVARFVDRGGSVYRGPLRIEDGRRICQIRDPFGNVLGLVGP